MIMSTDFENPKTSKIYGSFGEFTIGESEDVIRAKYILTKIRPGNDGSWECDLASEMRPWREVFKIEELSFDELLQRDLDDSRVAHELIPYLLGKSGNRARFFPPILAVIVPRKSSGSGIESLYPTLIGNEEDEQNEQIEKYGNLFDFEQIKWGDNLTPLASISYNRQRSAFIIVDGQHRAMAVLALHRNLNEDWGDNPFISYYDHIMVDSDQVKSIELPVCIIYFPDLHTGNSNMQNAGIDLSSICREIFLIVNRSAKIVSEARRLLLDDEDLAARLMRKTLSTLKDRNKTDDGLARIYSISYGDSDTEIGDREVSSGRLEYCTAITLHKVHRALFFGVDEAFRLEGFADITYRYNTKNSSRPIEILLGTGVEHHATLPYNSGKSLLPDELDEVTEKLGALGDKVLIELFDEFRPFTIHNSELRRLRMKLSDPNFQSQVVQKKAYNLIFDGSGVRNVFESHFIRLKDEAKSISMEGNIPSHLQRQIEFCESVNKALAYHEREFHRFRACSLFNIDSDLFNNEENHDEQLILIEKDRILYRTLATQAFQIGYTMTIFTVVEELKRIQSTTSALDYVKRLELVTFITDVYIAALNNYFTPKDETIHRTLTGYITESRASVFDRGSQGFQGLLSMSVNELNERQWRFYRYVILEIVHSRDCWDIAKSIMKEKGRDWLLEWYKHAIPALVEGIFSEREKYVMDAINASIKGKDFEELRMRTKTEAEVAGKNDEQIQESIEKLEKTRMEDAKKSTASHLKASLKILENKEGMLKRLSEGL